jgi:hypothetical protein
MSPSAENRSGAVRRCELCGRAVARLTKHHLIPRTRHHNKRNKRRFDRVDVHTRVLWLCRPCHGNIHEVLTAKQLENDFNTRETLAGHPEVRKFTEWIRRRRADTTVPMRRTRRRGRG